MLEAEDWGAAKPGIADWLVKAVRERLHVAHSAGLRWRAPGPVLSLEMPAAPQRLSRLVHGDEQQVIPGMQDDRNDDVAALRE